MSSGTVDNVMVKFPLALEVCDSMVLWSKAGPLTSITLVSVLFPLPGEWPIWGHWRSPGFCWKGLNSVMVLQNWGLDPTFLKESLRLDGHWRLGRCLVITTTKLQKLLVFAFLTSYSSQLQFKHLQLWLPIREEFLTIIDAHHGRGCLQSGIPPVSEGPRDICLSWLIRKQCLWEEGWVGRGRGLKSFWIPKPHFII